MLSISIHPLSLLLCCQDRSLCVYVIIVLSPRTKACSIQVKILPWPFELCAPQVNTPSGPRRLCQSSSKAVMIELPLLPLVSRRRPCQPLVSTPSLLKESGTSGLTSTSTSGWESGRCPVLLRTSNSPLRIPVGVRGSQCASAPSLASDAHLASGLHRGAPAIISLALLEVLNRPLEGIWGPTSHIL